MPKSNRSISTSQVTSTEEKTSNELAGAEIVRLSPERCPVCVLPMPANSPVDQVCSRQCAGRRKESIEVARQKIAIGELVIAEVNLLDGSATICPGELSHRVFPNTEKPLTVIRPIIYELAMAGKIRLRQKGQVVRWDKIRGPFRVGKS